MLGMVSHRACVHLLEPTGRERERERGRDGLIIHHADCEHKQEEIPYIPQRPQHQLYQRRGRPIRLREGSGPGGVCPQRGREPRAAGDGEGGDEPDAERRHEEDVQRGRRLREVDVVVGRDGDPTGAAAEGDGCEGEAETDLGCGGFHGGRGRGGEVAGADGIEADVDLCRLLGKDCLRLGRKPVGNAGYKWMNLQSRAESTPHVRSSARI